VITTKILPLYAIKTIYEFNGRPGSFLKRKPKPCCWGGTERKPKLRFWQGPRLHTVC